MANPRVRVRRAARPALLVAVVAATALVVILARQKQSLEARYIELTARVHDPYVGMYVPAVRAVSLQGDSLVIGEPAEAERQVLFVFSTACSYSGASLPFWKAVAARLAGDSGVLVYGVSVDSLEATRAYALQQGLNFPIVTFTERRIRALYRLQVVPQTVILDAEGRVVLARLGVVGSDAAVDSIIGAARAAAYP